METATPTSVVRSTPRAAFAGRAQWAVVLVVMLVYALPMLLAWTRHHKLLYADTPDDTLYQARVLALVRGEGLANPYLAEHQDAPRYMPEIVERVYAAASRGLRLDPLLLVAVSRVIAPALIVLVVCALARSLGMDPLLAVFAGLFTPLAPSFGRDYALRYFRVISPSTHVLMFLFALWLVSRAWRRPSARAAALAGLGLGLLFYVPVYYWSSAVLGTALLALLGERSSRPVLLGALAIAVALGSFNLLHAFRLTAIPEVQETLARVGVMTPGRAPEQGALLRFALGLAWVGFAGWAARKGRAWARFCLPFCATATFMLMQNAITNREIQSYHMINVLIPLWTILVAGALELVKRGRNALILAASALLIAFGVVAHTGTYRLWLRNIASEPELYALDSHAPQTLDWLNRETPPRSIILTRETASSSLPLFTRARLYTARYVPMYVLFTGEVLQRYFTAQGWKPGRALPYPADYFLGFNGECSGLPASGVVYRNLAEGTCVFRIADEAAKKPRELTR